MTTSRARATGDARYQNNVGNDLSLRGKALARAVENRAPRTLTAWEWEEWYAQHGVPAEHRKADNGRWWRRFFRPAPNQRPPGSDK